MQKSDFSNLIKKYYLEKQCPSVKWTIKDKKVLINFTSEDLSTIGTLDANLDLEDREIGIFDTTSLLTMLGALDNEINLSFNYEKNTPTGIRLSDGKVDGLCILADLSVIPESKTLKALPEWDYEIPLKKELVDRFVKSSKALADAKLVGLIADVNSVDFVINYSETNTNRITVQFPAEITNHVVDVLAFNVNILTTILSCNSDFREGKISVSSRKLMMIEFKGEDYEVKYFMKGNDLN